MQATGLKDEMQKLGQTLEEKMKESERGKKS